MTDDIARAQKSIEGRQTAASAGQHGAARRSMPGDGSLHVRWRRWLEIGTSPRKRRLQADITEFDEELKRRVGVLALRDPEVPSWVRSARELLQRAEEALNRSDLATGYSCLLAAQRMGTWGLPPTELIAAAVTLHQEASSDKIGGWRGKTIVALLQDVVKDDRVLEHMSTILSNDAQSEAQKARLSEQLTEIGGGPGARERLATVLEGLCAERAQVSTLVSLYLDFLRTMSDHRARVLEATRLRDEGLQNEYRKIAQMQQQLSMLGLRLALSVAGIIAMVSIVRIPSPIGFSMSPSILGLVAFFGALGGSLTAILSVIKSGTRYRIPQQLIQERVVLIRPLFGAAAALAVYTFLGAGLVTVARNSNAAIFAVSFAAGFSEQLITYSVNRFNPAGETTQQ